MCSQVQLPLGLCTHFSFLFGFCFCWFPFWPCGACSMWDLSSSTRIKPTPPAVGAQSLNHWTTREVPCIHFSMHTYARERVHRRVCVCVRVCALPGFGCLCPTRSSPSPLPSPEVASGAAAQEATGGVGTAVATGAAPPRTLIHVLAAPEGLVEVKAGGADAAEAAQHVAAGGAAAGRG